MCSISDYTNFRIHTYSDREKKKANPDRCPLGAPTPAAGIAASGEVVGTSSSSVGLPHPPTPHGVAVRLVLLLRCSQSIIIYLVTISSARLLLVTPIFIF